MCVMLYLLGFVNARQVSVPKLQKKLCKPPISANNLLKCSTFLDFCRHFDQENYGKDHKI